MERAATLFLFAAIGPVALAQTSYPGHLVQGVAWNDDVHHIAVTQPILSPGTPSQPMAISGTADAEFVSVTQVRLRPGFHAGGFSGGGRFRARIDASLGTPGDVVIVAQEPYSAVTDNVVHVHKWEKLEIGLRLPQEYQDAIDRFFSNYYPNAPSDYTADPGNVDQTHDLNPYADDSLQLVMTLTSPTGQQRIKWGFFMREARWSTGSNLALLTEHTANPLHPYHIRFRFAPDEEGPWQFALSIKAPHTSTMNSVPLPDLLHTGFGFVCGPPLEGNRGHLSVTPQNHRNLWFEDAEEPFVALGTNMPDWNRNTPGYGFQFRQRDYNIMLQTMADLHDVGGNFLRMFLMRFIFAPEWVNLGVYDRYIAIDPCDDAAADMPTVISNCQWQCWAFDNMLAQARDQNIYLQLCIDPYPPIANYEGFLWGQHPYWVHYVEPHPQNPPLNRFNLKTFFYTDGDPANTASGVFYYWKRKYKYLMARWGWSVNIAAIEPFNEVDQMLSYQDADLTDIDHPNNTMCPENGLVWDKDPELPGVLDQWITDLTGYVRGEVNPNDLVNSPLGEASKLFLMSYTNVALPTNTVHHLPFTNPHVDLIDVHSGLHPRIQGVDNETASTRSDEWLKRAVEHANDFWEAFPAPNAVLEDRKPFNHGEFNHYTEFRIPNPADPDGNPLWRGDIEKFFHNYDVSFHNELWSSVFSGKFAAGTTWHYERVFWWTGALHPPPGDGVNQFQFSDFQQFSSSAGDYNGLWINEDIKLVRNNKLHHHFRPLADLLNRPSVAGLGIFNDHFTAEKFFDDDDSDGINPLEAYYLKNDWSTAIGWVHNRNASVAKSFYVKSGIDNENFLGCTAPASASIMLSGFFSSHPHYITWFPTRTGATDLPPDTDETPLMSTANGDLMIDLSGHFNGIADNYLDTLRSDYAFVITPQPFVKSLPPSDVGLEPLVGWDFALYPNPASDMLTLRFSDESTKEVTLLDVSGRRVARYSNVTTPLFQMPASQFVKGAYWVLVETGENRKTRKLIIH